MTHSEDGLVHVDLSTPNRGRIDRSRMGKPNPNDTEPRPVVTRADIAATLAGLGKLKQRKSRKAD